MFFFLKGKRSIRFTSFDIIKGDFATKSTETSYVEPGFNYKRINRRHRFLQIFALLAVVTLLMSVTSSTVTSSPLAELEGSLRANHCEDR